MKTILILLFTTTIYSQTVEDFNKMTKLLVEITECRTKAEMAQDFLLRTKFPVTRDQVYYMDSITYTSFIKVDSLTRERDLLMARIKKAIPKDGL